jgi:hypothetical protein
VSLASRLIFLIWAFMIWLDPKAIALASLLVPAVGLFQSLRELWGLMNDYHRICKGQH